MCSLTNLGLCLDAETVLALLLAANRLILYGRLWLKTIYKYEVRKNKNSTAMAV
jgi:hypothetical protein